MEVMGYFLALNNVLAIGGRSLDLNDVSVKMADLSTLAYYLKNYPGFRVEDFKENQVNHVGDVGIYLSNNLRKFCLNGEGNAKDEGVVMTFTYKLRGSSSEDDEKKLNLANYLFLFRKKGLLDDTVHPLLHKLHNQIRNPHGNSFIVLKGPKQGA